MSTTTRKNRQRRADAPGKKSHQERRQATITLNDLPNDAVRREVSREVKACQRCHHKYGKQHSVILGENGEREIVAAIDGKSHYCLDCAKERRDELQRHDARPKKKGAKTSKSAPKKQAKPAPKKRSRKATPKASKPAKRTRKATPKPKAPAKPAAKVETDEVPF